MYDLDKHSNWTRFTVRRVDRDTEDKIKHPLKIRNSLDKCPDPPRLTVFFFFYLKTSFHVYLDLVMMIILSSSFSPN
jgi:hypothetical protein